MAEGGHDRESDEEESVSSRLKKYKDIEEAFKKNIVDLSYFRVMLIGPSGVGKTSLFHGLKGLPMPEHADTTVFADTHHVKQQWAKTNPSGEWVDVTVFDMFKELAQLSKTKFEGHEVKRKFQVSRSDICDRYVPLVAMVLSKVSADNRDELILHVWDCGGQSVFLDILPAFVTPQTMYCLVYNASKPLESEVKDLWHHKGKATDVDLWHHKGKATDVEMRELNVTQLSLLTQWMASVHATALKRKGISSSSLAGSRNTSTKLPPCPQVLLVGTHGDDPSICRQTVLKDLQSHCEEKAYTNLICDSVIVDNTTSGKDPSIERIRENVRKFSKPVEAPLSWVLFRKAFADSVKKRDVNVVTVKEVEGIAHSCFIPQADVPKLLQFYHNLGVFLHYPGIEGLQDKVIANPQWFVKQLAKLFNPDPNHPRQHSPSWKRLTEKGILVESLYEEVWSGIGIEPSAIIEFLERFLLAAPFFLKDRHEDQGREFFVPAMLCLRSPDKHLSIGTQHASLHLIFNTHYTPPGFFVRLVAAFSNNQTTSTKSTIYRNCITFVYGEDRLDEITFYEAKESIQVDVVRLMHPKKSTSPSFNAACQQVLQVLSDCTTQVLEWFQSIEVSYGFTCEHSSCKELKQGVHYAMFTSDSSADDNLVCDKGEVYEASPMQQLWMKMPVTLAKGTVGEVCPDEVKALLSEVPPAKVDSLLQALEISSDEDPTKLLRRWCRKKSKEARMLLVFHLKRIGLKHLADDVYYDELQDTSSHPSNQSLALGTEVETSKSLPRPTMKELLSLVSTSRWYEVGLQLGLSEEQLEAIESENDRADYKRKMFKKWLASSGSPSWSDVVKALRSIEEEHLAKKVESHIKQLRD